MRYLLILGGAILLVALIVLAVGFMLPTTHEAQREAKYRATPEELFKLITNVSAFSQWRPSVREVEVLAPLNGRCQFREIGKNGSILYEIDSLSSNRLLVTRIADPSLPFGGKWTYEVIPTGGSTTLRITEDGEVYNPIFRFVSRFVLGHSATIDEYLRDVGRHFERSSLAGKT